jgi:hypothetical protein
MDRVVALKLLAAPYSQASTQAAGTRLPVQPLGVGGRVMPGPQWHSGIPAPFTLTGRSLRRPHAR